MACIGIEIGGSKLQAAIVDAAGRVLCVASDRTPPEGGATAIRNVLAETIERVIGAWGDQEPLTACGVGFGGPVNRDRRTVATSFHVEGWTDFPLGEWIANQFGGLFTTIENDTNAAALAEATTGAGRGSRVVFYSNCGSGIGGGLVIDGQIYHGGGITEMELGHLRIGPEARITEDLASGWSIDRQIRGHVATSPGGVLARLSAGGRADARQLPAAIAADDETALAILDDAARHYATALSHAVHLLAPQVVVLGGGVAEMGELWRERVARHLRPLLMGPMQPGPDVRLAWLGSEVVPVGAALVAAAAVARRLA